jgi:heat shock transcription factor
MQTYPQDASMPTDQYMSWNDPTMGADMGAFNDQALFDNYGANPMNSGHNRVVSLDGLNDVSAPEMGAGQLVRRNPNQQLAPAPRRGQWDGYNSPTQQWETIADDDEELEQKAAIAKKDAQAKRKQIPPFVQKLSRYVCTDPVTYKQPVEFAVGAVEPANSIPASLTTTRTRTSSGGQTTATLSSS